MSRKLGLFMTCHHDVSDFSIVPLRQMKFCLDRTFLSPRFFVLCAQHKVLLLFIYLFLFVYSLIKSMLGPTTWRSMASLRHDSRKVPHLLYIFSSVQTTLKWPRCSFRSVRQCSVVYSNTHWWCCTLDEFEKKLNADELRSCPVDSASRPGLVDSEYTKS